MTASSVLASCHKRPIRGIFALVCRRAASGHATTAEHTEKCASLHVQPQAQAASACDIRKVPKAEGAASFDHRTAHRESRKAPQSRHDLVVQANWFARRANQQKPVQPPLQKYFCFSEMQIRLYQ
jgi:hypothetical protein